MSLMQSRFPGTCTACGCKFPQGEQIAYTKGVGARHATLPQCSAAKAARFAQQAPAPTPQTLDLKLIVDFLTAAQSRGLKRPKLRVLHLDGKTELRLGLTTTGVAPGSLSVVVGQDYVGGVRPNGDVAGARLFNTLLKPLTQWPELQAHLLKIAKNPAAAAKEYAALMGLCSFCGKQLTDAGSVEVGYGPICADKWGLSHTPKGTPTLQEVV